MKTITSYTVARAIFLGILASTVLAQPSPPSQGIQIGNPDLGAWDIRFSLTVTQCEPVPIYYNSTTAEYAIFFNYGTPDTNTFLSIPIPIGAGYIEWICNVPAGYGFYAVYYSLHYFVIVQPGSSACLHDVTTTYPDATYRTTVFQSYTAQAPITTAAAIEASRLAT
jgi:hypothetical protein